jgi:hypothetical protein
MIIQEHISPLDRPLQDILKVNIHHHSHYSSLGGNEGDNLAHIPEGINESRSLDSREIDTYFSEYDSLYNYCIQIQYYIEDYQYEHENEVSCFCCLVRLVFIFLCIEFPTPISIQRYASAIQQRTILVA